MIDNQTILHGEAKKKFKTSLHWTFIGSIIYETGKFFHCFMLHKVLQPEVYGIMGSIFAFMYLCIYLSDFGATNSIPPLLHFFSQSKQHFKAYLIKYNFLVNTPIIITCSLVAYFFAASKFSVLPHYSIIIGILFFECFRVFFRTLLHTIFQAPRIILAELPVFFVYLSMIWIPYLFFKQPLTLNAIFLPHLFDSFVCFGIFIFYICLFYKKLPSVGSVIIPKDFIKTLCKNRSFNYLLRIARNMFTSNFLTPFLGIKFGFLTAGTFYIASTFVNAAQAVVKSSIGYSGNALLAHCKHFSITLKREAFNTIFEKLLVFSLPILCIFLSNLHYLINNGSHDNLWIGVIIVFFAISFSEFFFILYEQFYILEEKSSQLFFYKLIELSIFLVFLFSPLPSSPIQTLIMILSMRMISLCVIALNAYFSWRIIPYCHINKKIIITMFISLIVGLLSPYIIRLLMFI